MEGGDISNTVAPRFFWVWEGLAAVLPEEHKRAEQIAMRMHRWSRAVDLWEENHLVMAHIWDLMWRHEYSSDIITFKGKGFAEALGQRLEEEDIPVQVVLSASPQDLAKRLAYMPHVQKVFFGDSSLAFTFGSRGQYVPDLSHFSPFS